MWTPTGRSLSESLGWKAGTLANTDWLGTEQPWYTDSLSRKLVVLMLLRVAWLTLQRGNFIIQEKRIQADMKWVKVIFIIWVHKMLYIKLQ